MLEQLRPLIEPDPFPKESWPFYEITKLYNMSEYILHVTCRQIFRSYREFNNFYDFLEKLFYIENIDFKEYLLNLQILINIMHSNVYPDILDGLIKKISLYFNDFPILGLKLKLYKTKAPQILPSVSEYFDKGIENTLIVLESKEYNYVLDNFETGLKEFLVAKNEPQLKDVVEDMYAVCDELSKVILNDKNKGFKHIFSKEHYRKFGFDNKASKEIFRNLKDWMDKIKHGTIKKFSREDVEMIINLVASLIRFTINKNS